MIIQYYTYEMTVFLTGEYHPVNAIAGGAVATDGAGQQEYRQHGARKQVCRGHQASQAGHCICRQSVPVIIFQISSSNIFLSKSFQK